MNQKYEMIAEGGFFRIKALRYFSNVSMGDLGGLIEKESNLSHDGNCWVYDHAVVCENAKVYDSAQIRGHAIVSGYAEVYDHAQVYDDATVRDHAHVYAFARICGQVYIYGHAQVRDHAEVAGAARVGGSAEVYGDATVYGCAEILDYAEVYGRAEIHGDAKIHGNCSVSDSAKVSGDTQVYGHARVYGEAKIYNCAQVCGHAIVSGEAQVYYKMFITCGILNKIPTMEDLLRCSLGVYPVDGVVRLFKRVKANLSSEHDHRFVYPEKGIVECPNYNPNPTVSCGAGLHFSTNEFWPLCQGYKMVVADIHIDDIICVLEKKVRCKRANVVGVVSHD